MSSNTNPNPSDTKGLGTMPHVIFKVQDSLFAISSTYVLHIEVLGKVTPIVDAKNFVRGVILFNEQSIPVYDLRLIFGMSDYSSELDTFMQQRIADHENWVAELERSVENDTEFALTTNPHECAFGKWFDHFHTDNSYLAMFLNNVDEPHKAIHATGEMVKKLMAQGKKEEAQQAIREMKSTSFAQTKDILQNVSDVYKESSKEMLVILQVEDSIKSIIVDHISGIKILDEFCDIPPNMKKSIFIESFAKTNNPDTNSLDIIQVLDPFQFE